MILSSVCAFLQLHRGEPRTQGADLEDTRAREGIRAVCFVPVRASRSIHHQYIQQTHVQCAIYLHQSSASIRMGRKQLSKLTISSIYKKPAMIPFFVRTSLF